MIKEKHLNYLRIIRNYIGNNPVVFARVLRMLYEEEIKNKAKQHGIKS